MLFIEQLADGDVDGVGGVAAAIEEEGVDVDGLLPLFGQFDGCGGLGAQGRLEEHAVFRGRAKGEEVKFVVAIGVGVQEEWVEGEV